jgi:hypothetical protein
MSTRSLTVFQDDDGKEIVVMYRQYDGYPEGHGLELKKLLADLTVCNGIRNLDSQNTANGIECLTAKTVCHFKQQFPVGGIYLYPAGTRDVGECYIYTVKIKNGKPSVSCFDVWDKKRVPLPRIRKKSLVSKP